MAADMLSAPLPRAKRGLFHAHGAARGFFPGVMRLVGEHPLFGAAGALAFLAADAFHIRALRGDDPLLPLLNLVEQEPPGEKAVQSLLAGFLAFHLQAGRAMEQHHAGGGLVDILSAVPAGADKTFFNLRLAHAQRGHALRQLAFLFSTDRKRAHHRTFSNAKPFRYSVSGIIGMMGWSGDCA